MLSAINSAVFYVHLFHCLVFRTISTMTPNSVRFTCTALAGTGKRGLLPPDADGYRIQPIGGLNCFNNAGEYYTAQQARRLFERSSAFMRRVSSGCLKGEDGHPVWEPGMSEQQYISRVLRIHEPNVCAHFAEVWLDFESMKDATGRPIIAIMGKVKPAGQQGAQLEAAYNNPHEDVCFSVRAFTADNRVGGVNERTLIEIVTFDRVNEPGIGTSRKFRSASLESMTERQFAPDAVRRACKPVPGLAMESISLSAESLLQVLGLEDSRGNPAFMDW